MATTRTAYSIADTYRAPGVGWANSMKIIGAAVALTAADVGTINNVVKLFKAPKGFVLTGLHLDVDDLDSNGSPAITLDIGDATLATRLASAITTAQAGGVVNVLPAGVLGFVFTADTDIQVLMHAAAATGQAGTIRLFLEGYIQ